MNTVEYYRGILDNLTGGLVSVDMNGSIVYMNPMSGRILRLTDISLFKGVHFEKALAGFPSLCGVINETLKTKNTVRRSEISILHANTPLIIGYSTLLIKDNAGGVMGIAVIFQDITFAAVKK